MPVHKIPRAALHEDLKVLEREHEQVISITVNADDPAFFDVTTRYCHEVETRGGAA